ncbi:hypothetical protein [Sporosarcina sp. G11-34]|uniref:hypothetical protein n=1 Tax=Sporosarcina sp. G11-34 TaxID=2849605 RepID=UPI0022A9670F|nr:hypothetical protein [Sporosarcina sp. G11-34]MCZ2260622.1 hypothetical protein [Sporosarcina sp. G11-34]
MNEIWAAILTSTVVTAIINIGWKFYENKTSFNNAKYMQISNYYRESSGKEMHSILESWSEMLLLMDEPGVKERMEDEAYLKNLINNTFLYSSPETCKRLAVFQQYNYTELTRGDNNPIQILVLTAGIIVSLKHDFTGEWVSIEEVLKIKINDFNVHEDNVLKQIKGYKY